MGIYLKGMEMPKDCWHCYFADPESGECLVDQKPHGDWEEPENCPLVPVPPHGRLADMDKIENEIARLSPEGYTTGGIRLILDSAPTIIPEEEGET